MSAEYPSFNDREFDLLKKIANNTAELADGSGIPLTIAEANLLYFRLDGTNSGLTASRVLFAGAGGTIRDDADLTFDGTSLRFGAVTPGGITGAAGALTLAAAGTNQNITLTPSGNSNGVLTAAFTHLAAGSATTKGLDITADFQGNTAIGLQSLLSAYGAGGNNYGRLAMNRARGTLAVPAELVNGDTLGAFVARAYFNSSFGATAEIDFTVDGTVTAAQRPPSRMEFYTNTSNGAQSERLRIEGMGRVSVGRSAATSAAWGVNGAIFQSSNPTITDSTSSGTVATAVANSFAVPTFAASSATTFTNAANLYIAGDVANGTNVTLTNSYGLWNVGKTRLDGIVQAGTDTTSTWHLNVYHDGGASAPTYDRNISSRLIGTLTANNATSYRAGDFFANVASGGFNLTGVMRGINAAATTNGANGGTYTELIGGSFSTQLSAVGAPTVTLMQAVTGTNTFTSAGTTTDAYGFRSLNSYGNGTVTNYYGFSADAPSNAAVGSTLAAAFAGNWTAATGRYGLYFPGTAQHLLGGAVMLPSTNTAGLQLYNTADQTTNYERLGLKFGTNIAQIGTDTGTTATGRNLHLYAQSSNNAAFFGRLDIPQGAFPALRQGTFTSATGTTKSSLGTVGTYVTMGEATFAQTSGPNVIFAIIPTYNQASGNAANTDLLINRTQTAVGSGAQLLIDAQVGGTTKFNVTNAGVVNVTATTNPIIQFTDGTRTGFVDVNSAGTQIRFGSSTNNNVLLMQNGGTAVTIDTSKNVTLVGALITTPQTLSGAGAINLTTTVTEYTSTGGAQALTLANGTVGQHKKIVHTVDGGSGVLTPTTKIGFTTITFTNVGDSCDLVYTTTGWAICGIFGAAAA